MAVLFVIHEDTDSSSAEIVKESGWCGPSACYYIYADGTLEISGSGEMYDYTGFTHAPWYEQREDIRKIVIGDEITKLGVSAFIGLKFVKELTIPITLNSVVSDQFPAFAGCYKIEKINFTCGKDGYGFNYAAYKENNSWYQNTPWYQSRDFLKEINFADGIIHIGNDSFRELNITSVVLPDSVTSLGWHTFFNCTKLTDLTIPVSLNPYDSVDYPAFDGCTAVNKVTFTRGNGVPFDYTNWWGSESNSGLAPWNMNYNITKTIIIADDGARLGRYMFYHCNIGELTIPASTICGYTKAFCTDGGAYDSLEKVTITKGTGSGYNYLKSDALEFNPWNNAQNLKELIVEDGVTHLGDYAFMNCKAVKVVLPDSLVSFGECTFAGCPMKELTIPISLNAVWLDKYPAFDGVTELEKVTFTVGSGYGFDYAAYEDSNCWYKHTPWCQSRYNLDLVFEEGIKHIGSDAFRQLLLLTLTLPNSVESLGNHAFFHCLYLEELTIPITLNCNGSAKYPAFEDVYYLSRLTLTRGTDGMGYDYVDSAPFWNYDYQYVSHITFEPGIQYIGTNTFTVYSFGDLDGQPIETNAAYLSGHEFRGYGQLNRIDEGPDQVAEISAAVCVTEVVSNDRTDVKSSEIPDPVVKLDQKFGQNPADGPDSLINWTFWEVYNREILC